MKKLAFLLLLFIIGLSACNKDKTRTELLTDSNWYDVDATKDCEVDNYVKYNTDNTLKIVLSDVPCSDDWPDFTGKWKFVDSEGKIETEFGGFKDTVTILVLTEESFEYEDSDGDKYKFKHK